MIRYSKIPALLIFSVLTFSAHGASFNYNYTTESTLFTANDGTMTEWLHLDHLSGVSYVDMLDKFTNESAYEGYQYATRSEVGLLTQQLLGFDWSTISEGSSSSYIGRTSALASIFGYSSLSPSFVYGVTADVHPTFSVNPGDRRYELQAYDPDPNSNTDNEHMSADGISGISSIGSQNGHFAYRSVSAVPLPTSVWLFGSGLVGLIGVARRKKA